MWREKYYDWIIYIGDLLAYIENILEKLKLVGSIALITMQLR